MPKVKLEALTEGMTVTADVKNMDNMLWISAGCVLTARHINVLNAWGIAEVQVQAGEGCEESTDLLRRLTPAVLEKLTGQLQSLFWEPSDKNPVQAEVFGLALRRKARQRPGT
jgi:hypothetical protein